MNEIANSILSVVELITDKKIREAGFDKTIVAEVIDTPKGSNGTYTVRYQDSDIKEVLSDSSYAIKDRVYVLIPQSDDALPKRIIGKVNAADVVYDGEFQTEEDSYDIIGGDVVNSSTSFSVNYGNLIKILYQFDIESNSVLSNDINFNEKNFQNAIGNSTALILKGVFAPNFETLPPNVFECDYGIEIIMADSENNETSLVFNTNDMVGNPWANETQEQFKALPIDFKKWNKVIRIALYATNLGAGDEVSVSELEIKGGNDTAAKDKRTVLTIETPLGTNQTSFDSDLSLSAVFRKDGIKVTEGLGYEWYKEVPQEINGGNKWAPLEKFGNALSLDVLNGYEQNYKCIATYQGTEVPLTLEEEITLTASISQHKLSSTTTKQINFVPVINALIYYKTAGFALDEQPLDSVLVSNGYTFRWFVDGVENTQLTGSQIEVSDFAELLTSRTYEGYIFKGDEYIGKVSETIPAYSNAIKETKEYYYAAPFDKEGGSNKLPDKGTTSWKNKISETTFGEVDKYLWNYEELIYTNAVPSTTDPDVIANWSKDGGTGNGIESITEFYLLNNNISKPTQYPTLNSLNGWSTTAQETSNINRYLWNYTIVKYTDNSTDTAGPALIGSHGASPYTLSLDNDFIAVPADEFGNVSSSFSYPTLNLTAYYGDQVIIIGQNGYTVELNATNITVSGSGSRYQISGLAADKATVSFVLKLNGAQLAQTSCEIIKNKQGATGDDAVYVYAQPSTNTFKRKVDEQGNVTYIPDYLSIAMYKRVGSTEPVLDTIVYYTKTSKDSGDAVEGSFTNGRINIYPSGAENEIQVNIYSDSARTKIIDKVAVNIVKDGDKGADGRSIKSTTIHYAVTTALVDPNTIETWSSNIPSTKPEQYLWTRTTIDYSEGADTVSYTYSYQGKTGTPGTSVTVTSILYQVGTSATTKPTGTWTADIPSVEQGKYLWSKTTYSDGKEAFGVSYQSKDGLSAQDFTVTASSYVIQKNAEGVAQNEVILTAHPMNLGNNITISWYQDTSKKSSGKTYTVTSVGTYTAKVDGTAWEDSVTIGEVQDGQKGKDAVTIVLTNPTLNFHADTSSEVETCQVIVYEGSTELEYGTGQGTFNLTKKISTDSNITINGATINIPDDKTENGSSTIAVNVTLLDGTQVSYDKVITWTVVENGSDGESTREAYYASETEQNLAAPTITNGSLSAGWSFDSQTLSETNKFIYQSKSVKPAGKGTEWRAFSKPILWAKWGDDGYTPVKNKDYFDGLPAKDLSLTADSFVFVQAEDGTITPSSIELTANAQNLTGTSADWAWSGVDSFSTNIATLKSSSMTNLNSKTITVSYGGMTDSLTILKVYDGKSGAQGPQGPKGDSAVSIALSNPSMNFNEGDTSETETCSAIVYVGTTAASYTTSPSSNGRYQYTLSGDVDDIDNSGLITITNPASNTLIDITVTVYENGKQIAQRVIPIQCTVIPTPEKGDANYLVTIDKSEIIVEVDGEGNYGPMEEDLSEEEIESKNKEILAGLTQATVSVAYGTEDKTTANGVSYLWKATGGILTDNTSTSNATSFKAFNSNSASATATCTVTLPNNETRTISFTVKKRQITMITVQQFLLTKGITPTDEEKTALEDKTDGESDKDGNLTFGKWYNHEAPGTIPLVVGTEKAYRWTRTMATITTTLGGIETDSAPSWTEAELAESDARITEWCQLEDTTLIDGGSIYADSLYTNMVATNILKSHNYSFYKSNGDGTFSFVNGAENTTENYRPSKGDMPAFDNNNPNEPFNEYDYHTFPNQGSFFDLEKGYIFTPSFKVFQDVEKGWIGEFKGHIEADSGNVANWNIVPTGIIQEAERDSVDNGWYTKVKASAGLEGTEQPGITIPQGNFLTSLEYTETSSGNDRKIQTYVGPTAIYMLCETNKELTDQILLQTSGVVGTTPGISITSRDLYTYKAFLSSNALIFDQQFEEEVAYLKRTDAKDLDIYADNCINLRGGNTTQIYTCESNRGEMMRFYANDVVKGVITYRKDGYFAIETDPNGGNLAPMMINASIQRTNIIHGKWQAQAAWDFVGNVDFFNEVDFQGNVYNSNGSIQFTSDRNAKNSIQDVPEQYNVLFDNLRPVIHKFNNGTSDRYHSGFIAQETDEARAIAGLTRQDFAAVCIDNEGTEKEEWSLRYIELIPLNTWQIQKAKARINELEIKNTQLEERLARLEAALNIN